MRVPVFIVAVALASCTKEPIVPFEPEAPRAALMVPPAPLPAPKKGDDLGDLYTAARAAHGRESDKVRGLQGYIRTLLKERLKRQQTAKAKT